MAREAIQIVCAEATRQGAAASDVELFSEKYKRVREILALSRFVELYKQQGRGPELNFVEGQDDVYRVPDFRVFSSESAIDGWDIEITEIMEPGRRRHSEYKSGQIGWDNPGPGPDYQPKLTSHVTSELAKKFDSLPVRNLAGRVFSARQMDLLVTKGPLRRKTVSGDGRS